MTVNAPKPNADRSFFQGVILRSYARAAYFSPGWTQKSVIQHPFAYNRLRATVAQWIEQPPPKGQVGRSIRLWGATPRGPPTRYSIFSPASLITFFHLAVWDRTAATSCSGSLPTGSAPCFASCSFTSGSCTTCERSRLSTAITGFGVRAGANTPKYVSDS